MRKLNTKQVLKLSKDTAGGSAVMIYLMLFAGKRNKSENISQEALAKKLNRSRPSIKKGLTLLENMSLIETKYGKVIIK